MKIALQSVSKVFDDFRAVDDVSLEIPSGKLVALLGPSGSGKTTILRMIAGLEFPDAGRIFFGQEDATEIAIRDRGVGFVFQHYALFPHMTIAENIAFGMEAKRRRPKAEIREKVVELLGLVKLDGLAERFPNQISGGQRQRVALARALAVEPRVLLLDEPFGALDAAVRRDLRRWLRELHEDVPITTVFVTHDQEEALDLADEVVIIDKGRIVQSGTPAEVTRRPASRFVMSFLGDTNRFAAEIRAGEAAIGAFRWPAPSLPDGPADLFARPRDLAWETAGPGIPARLLRVLDRPDSRRLVAETESGETAEIDAPSDLAALRGDQGVIAVRSGQVFAR